MKPGSNWFRTESNRIMLIFLSLNRMKNALIQNKFMCYWIAIVLLLSCFCVDIVLLALTCILCCPCEKKTIGGISRCSSKLGGLGAMLAPSWRVLGPSGGSWGHLGSKMGSLRRSWAESSDFHLWAPGEAQTSEHRVWRRLVDAFWGVGGLGGT